MALAAFTAANAESVDFAEALARAQRVSGTVRSAQLDSQAKALQADALKRIGGPSASLSAFAGRVSTSFNVDLAAASGAAGAIGAANPGLVLPALPHAVSGNRVFELRSASIRSYWPLYTGGRLEALHGIAIGRAAEARADQQEAEDRNATVVAQRYFSVQLARHALEVRRAVVADAAEHVAAARRLEATGLISHAERLKADVALHGAQRDLMKAQSDHEIAEIALTRLVASSTPVRTTTPLFMNLHPVGSLQSFIETGMARNSTWSKIASKQLQADEAVKAQASRYSPTVLAIGSYDFNRSSDKLVQPNWVVGVSVSIPLIGGIDRSLLKQAAELDRLRVSASAEQAERDIPTLIETHWRAVEIARAQFSAMESTILLARENLRLQQISFRHLQATSLDVTDASVNLARVQTERVQSAYEYVMALARLLEVTGQPARLVDYAGNAALQIAFVPESPR